MSRVPNIRSTESVPAGPLAWLRDWLDTLRSWVRTRDPAETTVGDPMEKFLTRGEAVGYGLVGRRSDGSFGLGTGYPGGGVSPGGFGDGYVPDLTPPPTPTGLAVTGAISNLLLEWDPPAYTMGHGHAQTNIYGAIWTDPDPAPTFGDVRTKLIDTAVGPITFHSYATNPNTRWCIWIKWKTVDGVESASPAGGTNGIQATTGQDVAALLKVLAGSITKTELFASLNTRIDLIDAADTVTGSVAYQVAQEALARGTAIAAEALDRVNADNNLANQILLITAGAGEQFDTAKIWYFDAGVESWTGNGTPTAAAGFLRPADAASDAYVESPVGINAPGATYSQVKIRIRKTGTPTWDGFLWWRAAADSTWDAGRRVALTEPSYDSNGIGVVTVAPGWAVTVDRIRIDLSDVQDGTDYFKIDWAAVGRPAPGASTAALQIEAEARATADAAEVTFRETLATQLRGSYTGTDVASLSSGLVFSERQARVTAVSAEATRIDALIVSVDTPSTGLLARASALEVVTTNVSSGNAALASRASALEATVNDGVTGVSATASALDLVETIVNHGTSGNTALASRTSALESTVDTAGTGLIARATALENVTTNVTSGNTALATRALALEGSVNGPTGVLARATALETVTTNVSSGNTALASRASALESTVNDPTTGVGATASALDTIEATVNNGTTGVTATATRVNTLFTKIDSPTIGNNPTYAALQNEATLRQAADGSITAQYTVKMDLNGFVSGYGLMSSLVAGGTPTSTFIVNVDKFAVATPTTSVAGWSASNTVGLNEIRRIVGVDDKVLVCKTAGVTAGSAPSIAGAIGSLVTDNSVVWQIASRVPFSVLTVPTTINGASVPAGVYIDAAYVLNATIGTAQIALLAVDDARIADLAVAKLLAGNLRVGGYIRSTTYSAGVSGWTINADGSVEFNNGTFRGALAAATGTFAGALSAATGTFSGTVTVGSTPAISGTTMTGTGAVINSTGSFALGNASRNIAFNGTDAPRLNGDWVSTSNIASGAITAASSVTSAYPAASLTTTTETTVVTAGSVNTTVDGVAQPIYIIASFDMVHAMTTAAVVTTTLRLKVNGTTVRSWTYQNPAGSAIHRYPRTDSLVVSSPPTGAVTVTLTAQASTTPDVADDIEVNSATLLVLGLKR